MINKKLLTVSSALAVALGVAACNTDNLTNLNKNPNNPEDVPAAALFTTASVDAVGRWLGGGYDLRATEFVVQHQAEVQYPDEDRYTRITGGSTAGYFDNPYITHLEDLTKVVEKGEAANQAGIYGPALAMRTWSFSYLTNSWGDIPYFDALKGDKADGSLSPKYDAQKDIYTDMFSVLDKVSKDIAAAGNNAGDLGSGDPIYGGDLAKWQKFANSLRARLALLIINKDPATAATQLTAAFSAPGGVFTSNADNAQLNWPGDGVYNNPWATFFSTRDDNRTSLVLMNLMKSLNDPRIPLFAQPSPDDGTFKGAPNGLTAEKAAPYICCSSRVTDKFFPGNTAYGFFGGGGNSFPSFMITYAEVALIQAEAANRSIGGLTPAQAAGFYNAGVTASIEQWGGSAADAAAYLAQPGVAYVPGTPGLVEIAQQKWLALFSDGGTAWAEWRRTCVPYTISPGADASKANIPRRLQYSTTERSVNGANLDAAITAQGADAFETRMYWDTNPTAAPTYPTTFTCGLRGSAPAP
jgi:SusD/RagB-like outer membrane lipoprotein